MPTDPPPLELIGEALDVLAEHLFLSELDGPATHVALAPDGVEDPAVPKALARYFVGVMAGAVAEDATLSEELLASTPDSKAEARDQVLKLIGSSNTFRGPDARDFRDKVRNPWITEVIAHALLVLRKRDDTACLTGSTVALKQPHPDPRRQGLDLIGIYDDGGLPAAAIGEAKASRRYGRRRLNEAVVFFEGIDAGERGAELRAELGALRYVLPAELRSEIADGFWRSNCSYLPVIVYSEPIGEADDHDGLGALRPPVHARRLVALELSAFHGFFNDVSDQIRIALTEVLPDV